MEFLNGSIEGIRRNKNIQIEEIKKNWEKIVKDRKIDGKDLIYFKKFVKTLNIKEKEYGLNKTLLLEKFKKEKIDLLSSMLKNGYTIKNENDFKVFKKIVKLIGLDYNLENYTYWELRKVIDKSGENTNDGFVFVYDKNNRGIVGSKLYVYSDIDFGTTDAAGVLNKRGKFIKANNLTLIDDKTYNNNKITEGYGFLTESIGNGIYSLLNQIPGITIHGKLGKHPTKEEGEQNGFVGNLAKGIVDGFLDMGDAFEKLITNQESKDKILKLLTSGKFWNILLEGVKQDFKNLTSEDIYLAGKAVPNILLTILVSGKILSVSGSIFKKATRIALKNNIKTSSKVVTDGAATSGKKLLKAGKNVLFYRNTAKLVASETTEKKKK